MLGAVACGHSTTPANPGTPATPATSFPFLSATISVTTDMAPPWTGPFTTPIDTDEAVTSLRQAFADHHIGFTNASTGNTGYCAGGDHMVITLALSGGKTTQKQAYECGDTVEGTITGDIYGLVDQLDLVPRPGSDA